MSHLDPERLAALADDPPTPPESAHLAACAECRREHAAYVALLALSATERDREGQPLTSWEALAPGLRAEGLLRDVPTGNRKSEIGRSSSGVAAIADFRIPRWFLQAAAAIVVGAAGVVAGRWSMRPAPADGSIAEATTGSSDARLASNGVAGDTTVRFGSITEAQAVLSRAEREYRMAMNYLASNDTTLRTFRNSDVYRARLAALDAMAGAARDGVNELPHDPVINQAYLSTLAAREATLRQLGGALPTGVRLTGF
jgi:hypothetical protein